MKQSSSICHSIRDFLTPQTLAAHHSAMFVTDLNKKFSSNKQKAQRSTPNGAAVSSLAQIKNNVAALKLTSEKKKQQQQPKRSDVTQTIGRPKKKLSGPAPVASKSSSQQSLPQPPPCVVASLQQQQQHQSPPTASIYNKYREKKKRLELESAEPLRAQLRALEDEKSECEKKRYTLKRARELQSKIRELEEQTRRIESGDNVKEFVQSAKPFLEAHQKQQFCQPRLSLSSGPREEMSLLLNVGDSLPQDTCTKTTDAVLSDYATALDGANPRYSIEAKDLCKACGEPAQLHMGLSMLVCVKCGAAQPFLDATASLLSFNDDSYDYATFSYKRINHFTEWISAMQAKETTDIPSSVLEAVMTQLATDGVKPEDVNVHRVRDSLKKLKLRKYYEHTQLITCKITGRTPPRLSPTQEERIKLLFMAASAAFQQLCPPDRCNFLSYAYTTNALLKLQGLDELTSHLSLLRGQSKLKKQDDIWKMICDDLDWEFIPTATAS